MQITLKIGDNTFPAETPYPGADYVQAETTCPVCHHRTALVEHSTGRIVALAAPDQLVLARKEYPRATVEQAPTECVVKVRMPVFDVDHDTYSGAAQCCRCGRNIGCLTVQVSTIFGLEEDYRVLHGRCRVY